jgi:hypothetical protein
VLGLALPFALFAWACIAADRLRFYCDRAFLPGARHMRPNRGELAIYRALGIELFFWTYGADVRSRATTRALGEPNCCTDCTVVGEACSRPLRVTHAANHRMFKGTRYLEAAVRELREEGEPIELVIVEGLRNAEALELYRAADVAFDQCLIGFHGYFALEAMALGKPVLCYIRKREYLLAPDECPIIRVHAATLKEDLRRLLRERERLGEIGRASRAYVERYFTPEAFAMRLQRAYRDLGVTGCAP